MTPNLPRAPVWTMVRGTARSLAVPDWRLLWSAGTLWNLAFWIELIFLTWLALDLTRSAWQVALVGALRFSPQPIVGLIAGLQADRLPKRSILMVAQAFNIASTLTMTVVLLAGVRDMRFVYAAALVTGVAWAIDFPVRRAYARDLLPASHVHNAMSLDAASLEATVMLGRWLAGGLLALQGPEVGYVVLSVMYLAGFALLVRCRPTPVADRTGPAPSALRDLREGLRTVWANRVLRGVFLITLIANFMLFPYFSFAPVFARDVFHVGEGLLGLMSGMDGAGATVSAVALAAMVAVPRRGTLFAAGIAALGIGVALFSFSPSIWVAMPLLAVGGVGMGAFQAMQTALAVSVPAPELRGRVMGVNMVAMGMLPFGLLWVGWLAGLTDIRVAVGINALAAAALIGLTAAVLPALRRA